MAYRLYYILLRIVSSFRYVLTRRFTTAGQVLLAAMVLSAALGLDTNRSVAYQGFTLLLALLLISFSHNPFFRPKLTVRRMLPKTGTAGRPVFYSLTLAYDGKRPLQDLDISEILSDPRPLFEDFKRGVKTRAADGRRIRDAWFRVWQQGIAKGRIAEQAFRPVPLLSRENEVEVRMEILPLRRGRLELSELLVRHRDPFGLVHAFAWVPAPQSMLILPRRYAVPDMKLPGSRAYHRGGLTLSTSVADSEEFQSLREYRPGDPVRLIHWKSWARAGKPVIREFQDEFFVRHALVLDTFITPGQEDLFEEAVSVAASFACTVQTQESLLDLLFVGTEAYCETAGRGQGRTEQLLEVLACVPPCKDKPFSTLSAFVLSRRERLSGCICVFLAWEAERKRFVERLAGAGVKTLAFVITDRERRNVADPGSGHPPWLHFLEAGKIEEGLSQL